MVGEIPCKQCGAPLTEINKERGDYRCNKCNKPYRLTTRAPSKALTCGDCGIPCELISESQATPEHGDVVWYACPRCSKKFKKTTSFRYKAQPAAPAPPPPPPPPQQPTKWYYTHWYYQPQFWQQPAFQYQQAQTRLVPRTQWVPEFVEGGQQGFQGAAFQGFQGGQQVVGGPMIANGGAYSYGYPGAAGTVAAPGLTRSYSSLAPGTLAAAGPSSMPFAYPNISNVPITSGGQYSLV